jgi:hypothetical protein
MNRLILVLCALVAVANAGFEQVSLKSKISQALQADLEVSAQGVENCENKCDKVFQKFAYLVATSGNSTTYE